MAAVTPAQAPRQESLQARRARIVRELDRINREIAEAQRQFAVLDTRLGTTPPARAAA